MSQNLVALNGGTAQIETSSTFEQGVNLSPQYVDALKLNPHPTEWVENGRPIYARLPSASQLYKLDFGLDDEFAYTYLPVGDGRTGTGSLQVQSSGENKFLTVQSGVVVWKYGSLTVDPVIISLEEMGMISTKYLLAYQLYYDDSPFVAEYSVNKFSLSGYDIRVESSTDAVPGWRYNPAFAFTDLESQEWRNFDGVFPSYTGQAYLSWQSPHPAAYTEVELRCPDGSSVTGSASLYVSSSPPENDDDPYCSDPVWILQGASNVASDANGQYFKFSIPEPSYNRGWKVVWTDTKVAINRVLVSGTLSLLRKPAAATSVINLVAYPENSVPKTVRNSTGKEVPVTLCKLAYVSIDGAYRVEKITDLREVVHTDHQPLADWLTRALDTNLINLFSQVKGYSSVWMSPQNCMRHEYATLQNNLVAVKE
jgi:hypothetical protein